MLRLGREQAISDHPQIARLRTELDHSSPAAKADILRYNHQAFCELVKTARERANIFTKKTRIHTLHILWCQISNL